MISIRNISIKFNNEFILNDFSLDIPEKGAVCLFAPSGSGKTTILRLLCGLNQPTSGSVSGLEGKRLAVLFQENRLLPHLSALDNLKLVLSKERQAEAPVWLEKLGLGADAAKTPLQLSGGMNRRLAIARTLAYGGDIYLLDEPFQGLDEDTLRQTMKVVQDACKDSLLILVTHRREEAQALCDRIITLGQRPLQILSVEEIKK
ncbi:MAG: ATP-binding cassette domain-containing protein [Oscillospiraceae bacterium]|nr:ATP-binding cassette domain-containing protein [Oscillospiraceae bacterium]